MSTEFYNRNWRMPNSWNGSTDNNSKVSNYSMSFDGSSEFIDCGTDIGNYFGENYTGEMAISIWFKADTTSSDDGIFQFTGSTSLGEISAAIYANDLEFRIKGATEISGSFTDTSNWHNLIVNLYGPSGANQVYLDGVAFGSTFTYSSGGLDLNGETFNIGHYGGTRYFSGKLDHCCIFDYALSASQITALQGSSSTGVGNPMSLSAKPKFYYPIGDYAAFNGSEYLVPNGALSDYVFDVTGSGQLMNLGGSNLWSNILVGTNRTGIATFSSWVKGPFTGYHRIWEMGVSGQDLLRVGTNQKLYYRFGSGSIYRRWTMPSGVDLNSSSWLHIVLVFKAGSVTDASGTAAGNGVADIDLFINGNLCSQDLLSAGASANTWGGGSYGIRNYSGQQLTERSNVQIWNSELTSSEIETLYNNGSPYLGTQPQSSNLQGWWKLDASATFDSSTSTWSIPDDSSNSNTGTSSGMTAANLVQSNLLITQPYSRYSLDLDGTGDYVTTNLDISNSSFTTSVWVKANSSGYASGGKYVPFNVQSNDTNGINRSINQLYNGGGGGGTGLRPAMQTYEFGTNNFQYWFANSYDFLDGRWYNVVWTRDSSNSKIQCYVNGQLQTFTQFNSAGTTTALTDYGINPSTPRSYSNVTIGAFKNHAGSISNYYLGQVSNCSIFNTVLTPAQITELYNEGKPSNLNNHSAYSNLVSWWQLGENMSYDSNVWTVLDEKGTNNGTGANLAPAEDSIVNGVGTSANGLSDGMGGADNIIGDAPYSTANAVSYGMGVDAKSTSVPS